MQATRLELPLKGRTPRRSKFTDSCSRVAGMVHSRPACTLHACRFEAVAKDLATPRTMAHSRETFQRTIYSGVA